MKEADVFYARSCFDRRSARERRGRWWRILFKSRMSFARRSGTDRRQSSEKRTNWERISRWSSAPVVQPGIYQYFYGLNDVTGPHLY